MPKIKVTIDLTDEDVETIKSHFNQTCKFLYGVDDPPLVWGFWARSVAQRAMRQEIERMPKQVEKMKATPCRES
jgi:hypothetical protein